MTLPPIDHFASLLSHRARLTPNRIGLVDDSSGERHTYAELETRANRLANTLAAQGVQKGDRVAVLAHNHIAYIDLLFGLAKIGAILAPLNWRLAPPELIYILQDNQPKVLLCGPEFVATTADLAEALEGVTIIGLEGAGLERGWPPYESLLAQAAAHAPAAPELSSEDIACILYTSGTTGRPKGAMLPYRQLLWNAINTAASWGLTQDDIAPIFTPLFHAGGLFIFLTPLVLTGGRLILTRDFDPDDSLRLIDAEGCTVVLGVPTLFQMWRASPVYPQANFESVRFFISGGSACPPQLMQAWRAEKGVAFRQGYGLTEVGVNCFSMSDAEAVERAGSVGKPIFFSRARLVDPQSGREVGPDVPGELLLAGPHVCAGYWRQPEATAEALRDGWFHTGDMARRDADGYYTIIGRYKDMLKSGGENVYAAEVEAVVRAHPDVADCALIGIPDPIWDEVGLMVVALEGGKLADEEALRALCAQNLARFKIPKKFVFVETLPYSPYGKVVKAELKARYGEAAASAQ